jgi:hypothetical protein
MVSILTLQEFLQHCHHDKLSLQVVLGITFLRSFCFNYQTLFLFIETLNRTYFKPRMLVATRPAILLRLEHLLEDHTALKIV